MNRKSAEILETLAIVGLALFCAAKAFAEISAEAPRSCPDINDQLGGLSLQSIQGKDCMVRVTPEESGDKGEYRAFLFSSNGLFQIFNSFDSQGSISSSTASRSFFIFPRQQNPAYHINSDAHTVQVQTAGGSSVEFSAAGRITSFSGATFTQADQVRRDNAGGLELKTQSFLLLDAGYLLGDVAYKNPAAKSTFYDALGHTCTVTNSAIFDYSKRYDHPLKFATDQLLAGFLAQKCPTIDLSAISGKN